MREQSIDTYQETLFQYLNDFFASFTFYERGEQLLPSIERFLSVEPNKDNALAVYEAFLDTYRTPGLRQLSDRMREFEEQVAPTIPQHRDHYAHSVQVFLLGLAIYQRNRLFRDIATRAFSYPDVYPSPVEEFFYRWGLAALFHDIGYPVEIAYKSIQEYARFALVPVLELPEDIEERQPAPRIVHPVFSLAIEDLNSLLYVNQLWPLPGKEDRFFAKYPDYKSSLSTDILVLLAGNLAQRLKTFERETLAIMLRDHLVQGMAQGDVDHGFLSAIILLKWIGTLYLQSDWNPAYFYHSAVDAAAGILLHNLYDYFLIQYPFNLKPLTPSAHPLGYLLMLCDRLQETDRPEYGFWIEGRHPKLSAVALSISDSEFVMQFAASEPNASTEDVSSIIDNCVGDIKRVINLEQLSQHFRLEVVPTGFP
jgi:hypothetical protein